MDEQEEKKEPVPEPEVVSITSSSIAQITYDFEDKSTTVDFKDGKSVVYKTLPKEIFDALATAPSAGKFYNNNIRKQYA